MNPIPSFVVALIPTCLISSPNAAAMFAFIAGICGKSLGCCATTVASTFTILPLREATCRAASCKNTLLGAPRQRGSVFGKKWPMSASPKGPRTASQIAGSGRLIGRGTHVQTITAAFQEQYSFLMIKRGRGADDEFSIPELAGLVGFGHFGNQFIVSVKALRRWNCRRFERGAAFIHAISLGCRSGFDNSQTAAPPPA